MSAPRVEPFVGTPDVWDAFVRARPDASHCHLLGWTTVIERTFGHRVVRLAATAADGTLAGVLPLVRVKGPIFGDFLVSMPYLNYGGPLGTDDAVRALAAEAVTLADRWGVDLLELRSRGALPLDLPVSQRKVTVVLGLPRDADALMKQFPAKLRSQVRRPQKDGIVARSGPDELGAFYAVFARHMRDLGTPVLPRRLFETFRDTFGDAAYFVVARQGDLPVAAGCGLFACGEFEMIWASSLASHNRSSPNMLVYWAAMEACMAREVARFNFGRATPGAGTHKFKLQWGGVDEPLHWYQHGRGAAKTPSPDDAKFAWGPRLWRHLPLPLATAIGPHVVKGIP